MAFNSAVIICSLCTVFLLQDSRAEPVKCGHPAVPANARVTLSPANSQSADTKAKYNCDDGYELFGSSELVCSSKGTWSGEMPFCGTNVALRKPTNQSTTARGGPAINANDGDVTTVHDGKRCTETLKEISPWWQVDLLKPYSVRAVRVTTRGCCGEQPLQDVEIRVGNSSGDLQRNPLCAWFPGTIEEGVTKTFLCARALIGQHVFLQLVGVEGSLSLCEVQVFATDELSPERCAGPGSSADTILAPFGGQCYEMTVSKGGSFETAREHCQRAEGGDLVHGLTGPARTFVLGQLERAKPRLSTQLVWIGAQRDPGFTSRTWRWVDGEVVSKPWWGKDQPNNYNGEQNCVVLDGGRSWYWNDVGCNLDYLHWICQHRPTSCGSPDKLVNTTLTISPLPSGTLAKHKSIASYQCPEGHKLVGGSNRTCQEDGSWTGRAPSCQYVDCGPLEDLEHGSITLRNKRTTHGAVAVHSCNSNYTLSGNEIRTCSDDGRWSGESPKCLLDWCPEPEKIEGGTVTVKGRRAGSIATYTCENGFILFGPAVVTCGLGGQWTGKAPVCRYVDCGAPALPDRGSYQLVNGTTTVGSIARFTCMEDYWLDGQAELICTREGRWSNDPPSCVLTTCEEPEVPTGGFVVGYDFNVHSVIEFHCDPGHTLRGQSTSTCMPNGEWSQEMPECQYIDCGKVSPMLYGSAQYANGSTYLGSELHYGCTKHYRLNGPVKRICEESGLWSGETPKCEEVRCQEPQLTDHAILSVTGNDRAYGRTLVLTGETAAARSGQTYKIGSLAKYRCERGYRVVGEPLRTCDENGQFTGQVPTCLFVDCGAPQAPIRGRYSLVSNVTYYGSAALYECEPNFKLEGHERRICLENGTWSSETPTCSEIRCGNPETGPGVMVNVASYQVGGLAYYSCIKGGEMQENVATVRHCSPTGKWNGSAPFCKLVDCGHPGSIENGRVIVVNQSTIYQGVAEYHCIPQFERIGPYLRKCLESGLWSGEEPRCQLMAGETSEPQNLGLSIGIACGVVLFLLLILGLIYLRLKKATPVKNTENVQAAVRKEDRSAAVMSYATLNDGTGGIAYGMPPQGGGAGLIGTNVYENITDATYDSPYAEPNHAFGPTVTINGVAIR